MKPLKFLCNITETFLDEFFSREMKVKKAMNDSSNDNF